MCFINLPYKLQILLTLILHLVTNVTHSNPAAFDLRAIRGQSLRFSSATLSIHMEEWIRLDAVNTPFEIIPFRVWVLIWMIVKESGFWWDWIITNILWLAKFWTTLVLFVSFFIAPLVSLEKFPFGRGLELLSNYSNIT